jgi:hypothetical protein
MNVLEPKGFYVLENLVNDVQKNHLLPLPLRMQELMLLQPSANGHIHQIKYVIKAGNEPAEVKLSVLHLNHAFGFFFLNKNLGREK